MSHSFWKSAVFTPVLLTVLAGRGFAQDEGRKPAPPGRDPVILFMDGSDSRSRSHRSVPISQEYLDLMKKWQELQNHGDWRSLYLEGTFPPPGRKPPVSSQSPSGQAEKTLEILNRLLKPEAFSGLQGRPNDLAERLRDGPQWREIDEHLYPLGEDPEGWDEELDSLYKRLFMEMKAEGTFDPDALPHWMQRDLRNLWGESPALRKALSKLRFQPKSGSALRPEKFLKNLNLSFLPRISLPSKPSMPKMGFSWGGLPSWPGFGAPSVPSGEGGFSLLGLALAAAGLVVLWKFRKYYWPGRTPVTGAPGPRGWPMSEELTTRADLIRAFELLSLGRLGPKVLAWNHLEIATGLGGAEEEKRRAASQLAALYALARYAPGTDPFTDADLGAARRSLSLLAGAASA